MSTPNPQIVRDLVARIHNDPKSVTPAEVVATACRCAKDMPDLYPPLTGHAGWGYTQQNGVFTQGRYRFRFQADAALEKTYLMSTQNGKWNDAANGDPNLANFMTDDADWFFVQTGYHAIVTPPEAVDPPTAVKLLANLINGIEIQAAPKGSELYRFFMNDHTDVVGQAAYGNAGDKIVPYTRKVCKGSFGPVAMGVDWKNDPYNIVIPANAATPFVAIMIEGFTIQRRFIRRSPGALLEAAWIQHALSTYPAALVGPLVLTALSGA